MLNVEKFQSEMVLKIEVEKVVHKWNDDEGMGEFVNYFNLDFIGENRFYIPLDNETDITIKDEVIKFLEENCNYGKGSQYDIINSTLMYNVLEDEYCNVDTINDKEDLFLCDYTISLSLNGISLDEEDLQEIF